MEYFIENFSFVEIGFNFLKFEGKKQLISNKYGFKVEFKNTDDFRYEGSIDYMIYIPVEFINSKLEVENFDNESDEFFDLLSDIRGDIEQEIFKYMKEHDLVDEIEFEF